MATFTATTPSPPPTVRTPNTPRFGYGDSWEPYSPRKSARISSQRSSSARTPSPQPAKASRPITRPPRFTITRSSPSKEKPKDKAPTANPMASPAPSPRKRAHPSKQAMAPPAPSSDALTFEDPRHAAVFLGPSGGKQQSPAVHGNTRISAQAGMLPTPSKTPSRKHAEQNEANIAAISRNLFPSEDDVVPNPKQKRPKKYTGVSMSSFTAVDVEEPIQIFTDSHDRVPEVDRSIDNPFQAGDRPPVDADPIRRRSKRKTVVVPGEGHSTVDDAMNREDGLVYVFRGKKIFRKFVDRDEEDEDLPDDAGEGASGLQGRRNMTRSSIKPKLLFPPAPKAKRPLDSDVEDEEEADTDIEDHAQSTDLLDEQPITPTENIKDKAPATPSAPRFAPFSPPSTTSRTTRSAQKQADQASARPLPGVRKTRRSPFDSWQRVKSAPDATAPPKSNKRAGDSLPPAVNAKRTRC
ncbi:hypothetical protein RB597_003876 [Gaeumannomyces tritici]